mmetsp:Transcript_6648/g.9651  ORF Transcript_6648/g.9651 Transcript_6648/m.9651 type:complete len:492 (-) Transcript_6648:39-1514(-)
MSSLEGVPTLEHATWREMFLQGSSNWASSGRWEGLNPSWDKFFSFSCLICKRGSVSHTNLSRCSKCRLAYYCSSKCQKKDWEHHKCLCPLLRSVLDTLPPCEATDNSSWRRYLTMGNSVLNVTEKLQQERKPSYKIHPNDKDLWIRQRHCHVCYYSPAAPRKECDATKRTLIECPHCNDAACCTTPECQEQFGRVHTADICEKYLIGLAVLVMSMEQGNVLSAPSLSRMEQPVPVLTDWRDYFRYKISDHDLPVPLLKMPPVMAMITDSLSLMMTLLHCLTMAVPDVMSKTNLSIHVLGADTHEILNVPRYEEILHWLPQLQLLTITFVGPNLPVETIGTSRDSVEDICADCKKKSRIRLEFVKKMYHETVMEPPYPSNSSIAIANEQTILIPDIAIAANCGLHDKYTGFNASWEPTSKLLARMDVPVVYTAYTEEEGELDEQQLRQWGAKVFVSNTKNPWRGLRPFPDEFDCTKFYYNNFFFTVTKGLAK